MWQTSSWLDSLGEEETQWTLARVHQEWGHTGEVEDDWGEPWPNSLFSITFNWSYEKVLSEAFLPYFSLILCWFWNTYGSLFPDAFFLPLTAYRPRTNVLTASIAYFKMTTSSWWKKIPEPPAREIEGIKQWRRGLVSLDNLKIQPKINYTAYCLKVQKIMCPTLSPLSDSKRTVSSQEFPKSSATIKYNLLEASNQMNFEWVVYFLLGAITTKRSCGTDKL